MSTRYDIAFICAPIRTSKARKEAAQEVSKYLGVITPDERVMPGFEGKLAKWDRHRHGKHQSVLCKNPRNIDKYL